MLFLKRTGACRNQLLRWKRLHALPANQDIIRFNRTDLIPQPRPKERVGTIGGEPNELAHRHELAACENELKSY